MNNLIDLKYLKELSAGNKAFEKEMIELFLDQTPNQIEQFDDSITKKDFEAIAKNAHKLKSSFKVFGAFETADILKKIETLALEKDIDEVSILHQKLSKQIALIESELKKCISEGSE